MHFYICICKRTTWGLKGKFICLKVSLGFDKIVTNSLSLPSMLIVLAVKAQGAKSLPNTLDSHWGLAWPLLTHAASTADPGGSASSMGFCSSCTALGCSNSTVRPCRAAGDIPDQSSQEAPSAEQLV